MILLWRTDLPAEKTVRAKSTSFVLSPAKTGSGEQGRGSEHFAVHVAAKGFTVSPRNPGCLGEEIQLVALLVYRQILFITGRYG
jgi:hypothetical protein